MTVATQQGGGGGSSGLYDVLELILDRGLVIDAYVRVSLLGIELLTSDIRIVVASVDTYLRLAEACNRLDLEAGPRKPAGLRGHLIYVVVVRDDFVTADVDGRRAGCACSSPVPQ
ncbi:gas vesicle protein GvpJ [Streptomyces viridosporus]|uniref:gas vesicle protein GvpJ n=1 Tax=Streptomyces viridosporus TaxID=67581 RepID=UPI003334926C